MTMTGLPADGIPSVSIVMPVLNPHPVYFRQAIRSILAQTLSDLELIVVEDPSSSSAGEQLAEFADARIRHLLNPARTSFAAQINRGLHEARSDLVARFDADDVCEPDRLTKQVGHLRAHPLIDVLGSALTIIGPDDRVLGYRRYPLDHEAIRRAMPRYCPVAHPAVVYRKDAVLKAGGYRVTRYQGTEDYDLWSRLLKDGLRFANYPEPLVRYRIHPQGMKTAKLREMLRGTLEVKRTYWLEAMDCGGRARMWLERLLVWMPSWLVLRLFAATQFTTKKPAGPPSLS